MESGFFLLCDIAHKCISSEQCAKGRPIIYATLFYPVLSNEQPYPHFAPFALAFSVLLFPHPQGYLAFLLLIQFGQWGVSARDLGQETEFWILLPSEISMFQHHVSGSSYIQTNNVLTRTALLHVSIFYLLRT